MTLPRDHHQFTISGFADEIDLNLGTQLDVLNELGISSLDLRSFEDTNVLNFSPNQVERVKRALKRYDINVTSIGSPIGKIEITENFEPHFQRFETALERANQFGVEYVRVFSYYIPDDENPADYRDEVLYRMTAKAKRAAEVGVTLLHENKKDIYGDTPARCRDVLATVDSPHLLAAFDPANFLEVGIKPYPNALFQLVEYVEQLHIKDAIRGERGEIRPAGRGDGNIPAILDALDDRGFVGPVSLEPHLAVAGAKSGYSGPDGFTNAMRALTDCLNGVYAAYE